MHTDIAHRFKMCQKSNNSHNYYNTDIEYVKFQFSKIVI